MIHKWYISPSGGFGEDGLIYFVTNLVAIFSWNNHHLWCCVMFLFEWMQLLCSTFTFTFTSSDLWESSRDRRGEFIRIFSFVEHRIWIRNQPTFLWGYLTVEHIENFCVLLSAALFVFVSRFWIFTWNSNSFSRPRNVSIEVSDSNETTRNREVQFHSQWVLRWLKHE